ncbi:MAG: PIN domain-containing protein [Sphingobacteriales bacterium]|nr:MAG: PIN domain-containing protein [Sphingobacteriales bacterium]
MAFKIFLDANVLLDFLLKRENHAEAKEVIGLAVEGKVAAFITPAIVHILGYWLTKAYGATKAKQLLLSLLVDITVVDINHEITMLALNSKIDDIEDALQYYTALHHQLDYFISGDRKLQKSAIPILPVVSASSFLSST